MVKKSELRQMIREEIIAFKKGNLNEGILDGIIDRIFDGLKKGRTDKLVKKIKKDNPEFADAMNQYDDAHEKALQAAEQYLKDRGLI
jgi:hypothetical protein